MTESNSPQQEYAGRYDRTEAAVSNSSLSHPSLVRFHGKVTDIHISTRYGSGKSSGLGSKVGEFAVQVGSRKVTCAIDMRTDFIGVRKGHHVEVWGEVINGWSPSVSLRSIKVHGFKCLETGEDHVRRHHIELSYAASTAYVVFLLALIGIPALGTIFTIFAGYILGASIAPVVGWTSGIVVFLLLLSKLGTNLSDKSRSSSSDRNPSRDEYSELVDMESGLGPTSIPDKEVSPAVISYARKRRAEARVSWTEAGRNRTANPIELLVKLNSALENATKAKYAEMKGIIPHDIDFISMAAAVAPSIDIDGLRKFRTLRNKVVHVGQEPSPSEVDEAFLFCEQAIKQIL